MTHHLTVRLEGVRRKIERLGGIAAHAAYRPPIPERELEAFERSV